MAETKICTVDGCINHHKARGYCAKHYARWKRGGDPTSIRKHPNGTVLNYVRGTVLTYSGDDCLSWPFSRTHAGYAQMNYKGQPQHATRVICTMLYGPPQSGDLQAAHSCGMGHKGCVNPKHLRWASPKSNTQDKFWHGTVVRGETHGQSKLTEPEVIAIRKAVAFGNTKAQVARAHNISRSSVRMICQRKRWAHI